MFGVIPSTLTIVEPVSAELAVSVASAKLQFKSHTDLDDDLLEDWIRAGTQHFFDQTGRPPIIDSFIYSLDRFPVQNLIELPCPPLQSVLAVEYRNAEGDWVAFDNGDSPTTYPWEAVTPAGVYATRGWVQLKPGYTWPIALDVPRAVRVRFTAGYGATDADVPALVKTIIRYCAGDFDRYRTGSFAPTTGSGPVEVPLGVRKLIEGFKYSALQTVVPRSCL